MSDCHAFLPCFKINCVWAYECCFGYVVLKNAGRRHVGMQAAVMCQLFIQFGSFMGCCVLSSCLVLSQFSAMWRCQTIRCLGHCAVLEKPGRRAALASMPALPSGFPTCNAFIKRRRHNFSCLNNMISSGVLFLVSAGVISVRTKIERVGIN